MLAKIKKETVINYTKVSSMLIIIYFAMCFNTGLRDLEDKQFNSAAFSSTLIKPVVFNNDFENNAKEKSKLNRMNTKLLQIIFCLKKRIEVTLDNKKEELVLQSKINSITQQEKPTCEALALALCGNLQTISNLKNLQEEDPNEDICLDTIISMSNAVYFSLVFFLGALINNKGILKIGTL